MTAPVVQGSRSLDAEVAEKVMGYVWRRSRSTGRRCIYPPHRWPEHMEQVADGTEPLVEDWTRFQWTPAYSTDIAAAWLVVEKLRERGVFIDIETLEQYRVRASWAGADDEDIWQLVSCHHESAPFGICTVALAALSSVEASQP